MYNKNKDPRPINLQLWTIRFPITAIVSILHRISGFGLFLMIPFLLYALQYSLGSNNNFIEIQSGFNNSYLKILVWFMLTGLFYHAIAGIRHLLMDMHIGDTKQGGKIGAALVLIITLISSLLVGVYLW